jgi:hypothetical protein
MALRTALGAACHAWQASFHTACADSLQMAPLVTVEPTPLLTQRLVQVARRTPWCTEPTGKRGTCIGHVSPACYKVVAQDALRQRCHNTPNCSLVPDPPNTVGQAAAYHLEHAFLYECLLWCRTHTATVPLLLLVVHWLPEVWSWKPAVCPRQHIAAWTHPQFKPLPAQLSYTGALQHHMATPDHMQGTLQSHT